jgi:acyl-CoA thioester hydrolase
MNHHPAVIPPKGRHCYALRVYYEDTDAGGIVYHATYLRYAERARTEAMRDLGIPHAELVERFTLMFVVRRIEVDYLRPARLDESLVVETEVLAAGGASATVRQTVRRLERPEGYSAGDAAGDAAAQAAGHRQAGPAGYRQAGPARGTAGQGTEAACAVLTVQLACVSPGGNKPGRLPPRWRSMLQAMRDARPAETATGAADGGAA